MTRLQWDDPKDRLVKLGVDRGVLYIFDVGYAWNGLLGVTERPSNDSDTVGYFDGEKYIQQKSVESLDILIDAITYPDRLHDDDPRMGLCYRTTLNQGYELHLVYNLALHASENEYSTDSPSSDLTNFRFDGTTGPVLVDGLHATSHIIINSNYAPSESLLVLEDILYGVDTIDPHLPTINEVVSIFETNAVFRIVDNGDGTWTAIGPDSMIEMIDTTTYKIITPSITYVDPQTYKIRSW